MFVQSISCRLCVACSCIPRAAISPFQMSQDSQLLSQGFLALSFIFWFVSIGLERRMELCVPHEFNKNAHTHTYAKFLHCAIQIANDCCPLRKLCKLAKKMSLLPGKIYSDVGNDGEEQGAAWSTVAPISLPLNTVVASEILVGILRRFQ